MQVQLGSKFPMKTLIAVTRPQLYIEKSFCKGQGKIFKQYCNPEKSF